MPIPELGQRILVGPFNDFPGFAPSKMFIANRLRATVIGVDQHWINVELDDLAICTPALYDTIPINASRTWIKWRALMPAAIPWMPLTEEPTLDQNLPTEITKTNDELPSGGESDRAANHSGPA